MIHDAMRSFVKVQAMRWTSDGGFSLLEDFIMVEKEFSLYIDNCLVFRQACSPGDLHALAVGYLCSEGYIERVEEVLDIEVDEVAGRADVRLTEPVRRREPRALPPLEWDPNVVMAHARTFLERSELFRKTGNVHSALMVQGTEALCFAEDLGRFNALDKCLGKAFLAGTDLSRCALFTSGRLPLGIVLKTIRAGIPMLISRSAPTDVALSLASRYRLQVVGFARGDRMTVYRTGVQTTPQRHGNSDL